MVALLEDTEAGEIVNLNVGGQSYNVPLSALYSLPESRLGSLSKFPGQASVQNGICDDYSSDNQEYYFERHSKVFGVVLRCYFTGKLHIPDGICVNAFLEEMQYWGMKETLLDACCRLKYYEMIEQVQQVTQHIDLLEEENFGSGRWAPLKKQVWELFERPSSSMLAKVVQLIVITSVLVSTTLWPLSTMPEFDDWVCYPQNATDCADKEDKKKDGLKLLADIDRICVVWFTFEYHIRLLVSPNKWKFFKDIFNLFDLLAILPQILYYILMLVMEDIKSLLMGNYYMLKYLFTFFDGCRALITLRIFKLARHNTGLRSFLFTLGKSYKELGILFFLLMMGVLIFSTLVFYAEHGRIESKFDSIPTTFWWSATAMNAIGFGGTKLQTTSGKLVCFFCGICGILLIGLPIPFIVDSFTMSYNGHRRRLKLVETYQTLKTRDGQDDAPSKGVLQLVKRHKEQMTSITSQLCRPDPEFLLKWETARSAGRPQIIVGGVTYEMSWTGLNRAPLSRLCQFCHLTNSESLLRLCQYYTLESNCKLYFHRDPQSFASIAGIYFTGKLHLLDDLCPISFREEMDYWNIDKSNLESCCRARYTKKMELVLGELKELEDFQGQDQCEENFGNGRFASWRRFVWDLIDKPASSRIGMCFGMISTLISLLSVITFVAKTEPNPNKINNPNNYRYLAELHLKEYEKKKNLLGNLEIFCVSWFTLELVLRFAFSPNKWKCFLKKLNFLDPPIILFYIMGRVCFTAEKYPLISPILSRFCEILRVIRLLKVFYLGMRSTALKALAFTLKSCLTQFGILLLFLAVGALFFSCIVYEVEHWTNKENFESIPYSFWWALTTMRTVAEGDLVTGTLLGKVITFVCGLFGLLFLVLPIPIIANNFDELYKVNQRIEKARKEMRGKYDGQTENGHGLDSKEPQI